jgi:hypothetical protein
MKMIMRLMMNAQIVEVLVKLMAKSVIIVVAPGVNPELEDN